MLKITVEDRIVSKGRDNVIEHNRCLPIGQVGTKSIDVIASSTVFYWATLNLSQKINL